MSEEEWDDPTELELLPESPIEFALKRIEPVKKRFIENMRFPNGRIPPHFIPLEGLN